MGQVMDGLIPGDRGILQRKIPVQLELQIFTTPA